MTEATPRRSERPTIYRKLKVARGTERRPGQIDIVIRFEQPMFDAISDRAQQQQRAFAEVVRSYLPMGIGRGGN